MKKTPVQLAKSAIGKTLKEFNLAYHQFEEELSPDDRGNIGLRFEEGPDLRFSCKGDGSVLVTKGELEVYPEIPGVVKAYIDSIDVLSDEKLIDVEFEESTLKLTFTNNILVLANDDDELEMIIKKR